MHVDKIGYNIYSTLYRELCNNTVYIVCNNINIYAAFVHLWNTNQRVPKKYLNLCSEDE